MRFRQVAGAGESRDSGVSNRKTRERASNAVPLTLLITLALTVSRTGLGLRPTEGYPVLPSDYGIIFDSVWFESSDGLLLRGWFFPAQDTVGISNQYVGRLVPVPDSLIPPSRAYVGACAETRPTVVICPGDAGNMSFLILYAYNLFTRGFNVFTFDWRGFGESHHWPLRQDDIICTEFLADYTAALDYVSTRPEVDSSRIGLLGFSTGAYMSFAMAACRNDIAAIAARATATSFEDLLPILEQLDPHREWRVPEDFPDSLLPGNAAPDIAIPVLLVVGRNDMRTPVWVSEEIAGLLAGPVELWIVEGAGHGGMAAPEMVVYESFFQRVAEFFGQHL